MILFGQTGRSLKIVNPCFKHQEALLTLDLAPERSLQPRGADWRAIFQVSAQRAEYFGGWCDTCMSQEHVFFFRTSFPYKTTSGALTRLRRHICMSQPFPSPAPLLFTPTTPCHNETASRHQTPNQAAAHTYFSSVDEPIPTSIAILIHVHSASSCTTPD